MTQEVQIPQNLQFDPTGLTGVYEEKIHLTKDSIAMNDVVIIEILEQDANRNRVGGIYMPESATQNMDMLKGKLISVGPEAKKKNLKKDDVILYDKWSSFYKPPETPGTLVVTKCENVICKIK